MPSHNEQTAAPTSMEQGEEAAAPSPTPTPVGRIEQRAIFLILHPDGDAKALVDCLNKYPDLKPTLIVPHLYFQDEDHRAVLGQFRALVSSKQIEVGLTLDIEPILPLLGDLSLAGEKAKKWGFSFVWPEDIGAQLARGSSIFQKRWLELPGGLVPPYFAVSEKTVAMAEKFRLAWVLGKPRDEWGVRHVGNCALMIPPVAVEIDTHTVNTKLAAAATAKMAMQYPFLLVDAAAAEDPQFEIFFLEQVMKLQQATPEIPLVTASDFVAALRNEFVLPQEIDPFEFDYSDWVNSASQKRAWEALAGARDAIESYQNSGRANIHRLNAAIEEMCNVESGEFLLALGQSSSKLPNGEKNFLATIANIYRLCQTPVPANLGNWFAKRSIQKSPAKSAENDLPFVISLPDKIVWNDPKGDDNGAGKYLYPAGDFPKGLFDLRSIQIHWTDSDLQIGFKVVESFGERPTAVLPLLDLYVDVNKLNDAGSLQPLSNRYNTLISREAAWEYALSISPKFCGLYQSVPGSAPRLVKIFETVMEADFFSVTVPRSLLRGDPKNWRISSGLMGIENSRQKDQQLSPIPVLPKPNDRAFGGGVLNRMSPIIDVLSDSVDDQIQIFQTHETGGPLLLPYIEAQ